MAEPIADLAWQAELPHLSVRAEDFDLSTEVARLRQGESGLGDLGVGAVASFVGTVRQWVPGEAATLVLEHYPGMTERRIAEIMAQARRRFGVRALRVIHRVGPLALGDQIVLVAVGGAHRGEAFAACEFLMDWLKTEAPFWKKEISPQGERWVDAREHDTQAAQRWSILPPGRR
jgi:molybdopterin synthase catalytic subunit